MVINARLLRAYKAGDWEWLLEGDVNGSLRGRGIRAALGAPRTGEQKIPRGWWRV